MYYSMDTIKGNSVYENNYVSDLSEFTEEECAELLKGSEICVQESYYNDEGRLIDAEYTCIHEDEEI